MIRRWIRRLVVWALGSDPVNLADLATADKAELIRRIHALDKRVLSVENENKIVVRILDDLNKKRKARR